MKQLISISILILAIVLPTAVTAHDFEVDGIYYNINGNKATVTFKGSGEWEFTDEYSGDVTIPSTVTWNGTTYTVTAIGANAFNCCYGVTSVFIPSTVTFIGEYSFLYCQELPSINIPNSVTTISQNAFSGCKSLTSIRIPSSVTQIGNQVFTGCDALTSITVASGNTKYDSRNNCNAIIEKASNTLIVGCKNSTVPNTVTAIGDYAFRNCNYLTSITIPNSVTTIGNEAFYYCYSLTNVNMSNALTHIGNSAFYCCEKMADITFPSTLVYIGDDAFSVCREFTSLNIPSSVTHIGVRAFTSCNKLTSITVASGNTKYDSRNNCNAIIEKATNTLMFGCKNTIIPNSVTAIGVQAFIGCDGLTNISIPNSVTSIGDIAFLDCTGLTSITIPSSITSIGYLAFYYCSGLTDVYSYIESPSLVTIGENAFGSSDYERTLHIPAGSLAAYQASPDWAPYFNYIVEMEPSSGVTGDVDGDGKVNISDVTALINILLRGNTSGSAADVDGDGKVTISDLTALINMLLRSHS